MIKTKKLKGMPKLLANKNYSSEHGTLTISWQYPTLAAKPQKFILIYYFVGVHIVGETQVNTRQSFEDCFNDNNYRKWQQLLWTLTITLNEELDCTFIRGLQLIPVLMRNLKTCLWVSPTDCRLRNVELLSCVPCRNVRNNFNL